MRGSQRRTIWTSACSLGWKILAVVGIGLLLVLLFGPVTDRLGGDYLSRISDAQKRGEATNSIRQLLLASAIGVLSVVGLVFTARTYFLSKRGQISERYLKAVSLISSEKEPERIGGIYALEHILRESPDDHQTVMSVILSYVRSRSCESSKIPVAADIQAALTVLARRPVRPESFLIDLSGCWLKGADLETAQLCDANFENAVLDGANLRGVSLRRGRLTRVKAEGIQLQDSDLREVTMEHANLRGANLTRSKIRLANLSRADLCGAVLGEADLRSANFTQANLREADLRGARTKNIVLQDALTQDAMLPVES